MKDKANINQEHKCLSLLSILYFDDEL